MLAQETSDGGSGPIAYYSRKLLPRERKYITTKKEHLAIVNAVKHFDYYLLGRSFDIVINHGALKYMQTT